MDFYRYDQERLERCQRCKYQNNTEFDACHICNNEKDMFRPRPSNADRIRAMTDADLAVFISEVKIDGLLRKYELPTSTIDWLYWLKQEAQDATD